jgi:RNA polymerase-binding transcription factor DksA
MSILTSAGQNSGTNRKRSDKNRRKDDSYFTIEDAREMIRNKKENTVLETEEQIFEQKKDILAKQSDGHAVQKIGAVSVADVLGFNPIQSKQKTISDKDPEDIPQKYRKYYKLLLKLKHDVRKDLSKLTNDNLAISMGKVRQDGVDAEIESFDSEFAISLMSNEQEALTEIEEAIQRINDGTYGICELTGNPIEPQRLMAVPFARFSIEGQKQMEKEKFKQIESDRGSIFQIDQSSDEMSDFEAEDGE